MSKTLVEQLRHPDPTGDEIVYNSYRAADRIEELEQALHDEKQATKSVILNYKAILKDEERQSKQLQSRIEELEANELREALTTKPDTK